MLYGVRRDLQERLVVAGYTVRVYVPFGSEWYPYFMRRLARAAGEPDVPRARDPWPRSAAPTWRQVGERNRGPSRGTVLFDADDRMKRFDQCVLGPHGGRVRLMSQRLPAPVRAMVAMTIRAWPKRLSFAFTCLMPRRRC